MSIVQSIATVTGHMTFKHYRRGVLINEFGQDNAVDNTWCRYGLSALATFGTVDSDGQTQSSLVPQYMKITYDDLTNQRVDFALPVYIGAGGSYGNNTALGGGPLGSGGESNSRDGGIKVIPQSYFNEINQYPSGSNFNIFEIALWHGGTYVPSTGALTGGYKIAYASDVANTSRIVVGDDLYVVYEVVIEHGALNASNANIPTYGGLTVYGANKIAQVMGHGTTNYQAPITKVGVYHTGNTSSGFGAETEFGLDVGQGNVKPGWDEDEETYPYGGWKNADFESILGSAIPRFTVGAPDTTNTATQTQVGIQKSITAYVPTAPATTPVGAWAKDASNNLICNYPTMSNQDISGYVTANTGKRHSLRFTIKLESGTITGYTW